MKKIIIRVAILFSLMVGVVSNVLKPQTPADEIQYISGNARVDLLQNGGYQYPLKGIGGIYGGNYSFGKKKWGAMLVICGAGLVDGMLEGYGFDSRLSFERKWGVDPHSYFGSKSWDSDWNAFERFKSSQVDFYHTADDVRKIGYVTGGFMLGRASLQNKRKIHNVFDLGISFACSAFWKSIGMQWVRDQLHIKLF